MLESYKWMVGWLSDCAYSKSTCGANNETTTSYRCIFIPQKSARSQQLSHMVCLRSLVKQWLFSKTVHPDISWFIVFINIPWLYSLNSSCNIKCNFTHDWMKVGRRITHFWRRGKRGGFPENESDSDFHIARFGSVGCTVVCLRLLPGKSTPKPLLRAAGVDCFHLHMQTNMNRKFHEILLQKREKYDQQQLENSFWKLVFTYGPDIHTDWMIWKTAEPMTTKTKRACRGQKY